jgi:hypothetical protein
VFQFRMWRGIVAHRMRSADRATSSTVTLRLALAGFPATFGDLTAPRATHVAGELPSTKLLVATRPNLARHLALVLKFIALCRTNNIALTIATTPMRADASLRYDPDDLRNVVRKLSEIAPIWDFGAPPRLAADLALWDDPSHFKSEIAAMMLARIFGPDPPQDFGVLRRPKDQTAQRFSGSRDHRGDVPIIRR